KSLAHLAETVGSTTGFNHRVETTDKPFALSPIQKLYFQTIGNDKNSHFNQSFTLRLARKIDPAVLKNALDAIVRCHSMLRARFSKTETGEWLQTILGDATGAYRFVIHNISTLSAIVNVISSTQKNLNIVEGP